MAAPEHLERLVSEAGAAVEALTAASEALGRYTERIAHPLAFSIDPTIDEEHLFIIINGDNRNEIPYHRLVNILHGMWTLAQRSFEWEDDRDERIRHSSQLRRLSTLYSTIHALHALMLGMEVNLSVEDLTGLVPPADLLHVEVTEELRPTEVLREQMGHAHQKISALKQSLRGNMRGMRFDDAEEIIDSLEEIARILRQGV